MESFFRVKYPENASGNKNNFRLSAKQTVILFSESAVITPFPNLLCFTACPNRFFIFSKSFLLFFGYLLLPSSNDTEDNFIRVHLQFYLLLHQLRNIFYSQNISGLKAVHIDRQRVDHILRK